MIDFHDLFKVKQSLVIECCEEVMNTFSSRFESQLKKHGVKVTSGVSNNWKKEYVSENGSKVTLVRNDNVILSILKPENEKPATRGFMVVKDIRLLDTTIMEQGRPPYWIQNGTGDFSVDVVCGGKRQTIHLNVDELVEKGFFEEIETN